MLHREPLAPKRAVAPLAHRTVRCTPDSPVNFSGAAAARTRGWRVEEAELPWSSTYPEYHPENSLATFRVDIDLATCGEITPLSTLDYLISSFDSDIITMDYRVRGFTRDVNGRKLFLDHKIKSIQDYISEEILQRYNTVDINIYDANLFHTKMMLKEIDLQNYLFKTDVEELPPQVRAEILSSLRCEMVEIFNGHNIYGKR